MLIFWIFIITLRNNRIKEIGLWTLTMKSTRKLTILEI
jgi:hypothetical protein